MPVTTLPTPVEYINPGVTVIHALDAVADVHAPTLAEISSGTDLTQAVVDASSWGTTADDVDTTGLASSFKTAVPGMRSPDGEQSLTFRASKDGQDARTVLPVGTDTVIAIYHGGTDAGDLMDLWPVRVKSVSKPINVAGSDHARVVIGFSVTGEPGTDVTIPTA